jgi:polyhydroxyalkanoate synthesis regulator phasin
MFETLDKLLFAGLGAFTMTREKAEKLFDELVARGEAQRGAQKGFVEEMIDSAAKTRQEFERLIQAHVEKALAKLALATKQDIERLEAKIDARQPKQEN